MIWFFNFQLKLRITPSPLRASICTFRPCSASLKYSMQFIMSSRVRTCNLEFFFDFTQLDQRATIRCRVSPFPSDRLTELTLESKGGPCPSVASWGALPLPASAQLNMADLGETVNGASRRARPLLGPFPERKGPRPPGGTPTKNSLSE